MKISHKIFGGFFAILLFFSLMLYYFIFPNFFKQTDGYVKENLEIAIKNIYKDINDRENINLRDVIISSKSEDLSKLFMKYDSKQDINVFSGEAENRKNFMYRGRRDRIVYFLDKDGKVIDKSTRYYAWQDGIESDNILGKIIEKKQNISNKSEIVKYKGYLLVIAISAIESESAKYGYMSVIEPIYFDFIDDVKERTGYDCIVSTEKEQITTIFKDSKRVLKEMKMIDSVENETMQFNGKKYIYSGTTLKNRDKEDLGKIYTLKDLGKIEENKQKIMQNSFLFIMMLILMELLLSYFLSFTISRPIGILKKYIKKIQENNYDGKINQNISKRTDEIGFIAKSIEKMRTDLVSSEEKIKYYNKELEISNKEMKNYTYIVEVKNKELTERLKEQELIKDILNRGIKEVSEITKFLKFLLKKIYEYKKYKRIELVYKNSIDNTYERLVYIPERDKFIENSYSDNLKYLVSERPIVKEDYIELPIRRNREIIGSMKIEGVELSGNTEKTLEILTNELEMVLENAELYYKMDKKIMELSFLNSISVALSSITSINELKSMIEDSMAILFGIGKYDIFIYEKGYFLEFKELNGEIIKIKQKKVEDESIYILNKFGNLKVKKEYYIPLVIKEKLVGVIIVESLDNFKSIDKNIMKIFLTQVAIIIQNTLMYTENKKRSFDIIKTLAETIEEKDTYTRGHSERVMTYSLKIAQKLKMTPDELEKIKYAGILHDVGKIGIPETILQKNGRLTEEEYNLIKQHPEKGARILSHISSLEDIAHMVKYHHEKPDGTGYPEGLFIENIPLGARILALADTFDAMTSDRPYRKGLALEVVVEELQKYSGKQFDAELTTLFLEMIESGEIKIENQ